MQDQPRAADNADQIAHWNDEAGRRWTELQMAIDAMFAPLTAEAMAVAAPVEGEHVVDIGCGCGATVLELAARVGSAGSVLGVDVSEVMLARAAERSAGLSQVTLVCTDASTHRFEPRADLLFSRFGVMFFDEPAAAFANLRTALAPGGRLLAVAWRSLAENAWAHVPWSAALPHLPPQHPSVPGAPGPFAFADADRVRRILQQAGYSHVSVRPYDPPIPMTGPGQVRQAAERSTRIGVVARALNEADPSAREPVTTAIAEAFSRLERPDGLTLGGAVWLISARR